MALSDYIGQELRIGPFNLEVMHDGIGVSTEDYYCGLLDNVYEETWLWLKDVASPGRIRPIPRDEDDFIRQVT